jgi:hypothetical protein
MSTRFNTIFVVGAMILIAGFMFQWLPEATIAGMERRLTDPNLSSERRNELEGALLSWEVWKLTTFNPLSVTLIVVGMIFILYAIVDEAFSLASKYVEAKGK